MSNQTPAGTPVWSEDGTHFVLDGKTYVIPEEKQPSKEQPHEDFLKAVHDMTEGIEELKKLNVSDTELADRVARMVKDVNEEALKNRKLGGDPESSQDPERASIDDIMKMKTKDPDIRRAQELNNRALIRASVRASKAGAYQVAGEDGMIFKSIPKEMFGQNEEFEALKGQMRVMGKAAGSFWDAETTALGGMNWVPTGFAEMGVDFYFLDAPIPDLFQQVTIPQGVGPFSIPIETTRGQMQPEGEQTAASANFVNTSIFKQAQTDTIDFTPQKHGIGKGWSMEAQEDIVVDVLSRAQRNAIMAGPRALTQCIINGQTASDGSLDDAPATSGLESADGYSNLNGDSGLRLHCIVNSFTIPVGTGNMDHTDFITARKAMGDFGANPDEIAFITSGKGYTGLLADTNVVTIDKMGPQATILTGQLASVGGLPVLFHSEFPDDMASGGIDAGTAATTGGIWVNHRRWYVARAREINSILLPQPGMDIMNVIARMRTDFKIAITDEHNAHYAINAT